MHPLSAFVAVMLLTACGALPADLSSVCNMPRGTNGVSVRWRGVLLDASPHGLSFIATDCQRRGITISAMPDVPAIETAQRRGLHEGGVIDIDLSGTITSERELHVTTVHSVSFRKMGDVQEAAFWRSLGF